MAILQYIASKGSLNTNGIQGTQGGNINFISLEKGYSVVLDALGDAISWTVPNYTSTKMMIALKGSGTVNVNGTTVTATSNWSLQEINHAATGTTIIVSWVSGTVYLSMLVIMNNPTEAELQRYRTKFDNLRPTIRSKKGFVYPKVKRIEDSNCVAAYSYDSVRSGKLIDLTNNGKHIPNVNTQTGREGVAYRGAAYSGNVDLGNVRSVFMRLKLNSATEKILEGATAGGQISVSNGLVVSPNFNKCYVNGVESRLVPYGEWVTICVTSSTNVSFAKVTIGMNDSTYGNFELSDLRIYNIELGIWDVLDFYNSFKHVLFYDDLSDSAYANTTLRDWSLISGTGVIGENVEGKYWQQTSEGAIQIQSKQAYGEWYFKLRKSGATNTKVRFVWDGINGYELVIGSDRSLTLNEITGDEVDFEIFKTAEAYVPSNETVLYKIVRLKSNGVFGDLNDGVLYPINSIGVFIYDNGWVPVSVNSGSNFTPADEHTKSEYIRLDLALGDRFSFMSKYDHTKAGTYLTITDLVSHIQRVKQDGGRIVNINSTVQMIREIGSLSPALAISSGDGIKAGKLYAYIPTSGLGDFTVTRAGDTGYVKNKSGFYQPVLANIPRIDYEIGDPTVLIEGTKSNLITTFKSFDNAYWQKSDVTVTGSKECPFVDSSGNNQYIGYNLIATGDSGYINIASPFTVSNGDSYTNSIFIKRLSGTGKIYLIDINGVDREVTVTNQWERYSYKDFATSANGQLGVKIETSGDSVRICYSVCEQGSLTSPIGGTEGSSKTRNADVISNTLSSSSEGFIWIEGDSVNGYLYVAGLAAKVTPGYYKALINYSSTRIELYANGGLADSISRSGNFLGMSKISIGSFATNYANARVSKIIMGAVMASSEFAIEKTTNSMGTLLDIGGKIIISDEPWYGFWINNTIANSAVNRYGNLSMHRDLPIQNLMKAVLLSPEGIERYELNPTNWTKRMDGTASNLTGLDGDVMIRVPNFYFKFTRAGNFDYFQFSLFELDGFSKIIGLDIDHFYVSAYEAGIDRTDSKLMSFINTDVRYRGGNNNADWDATDATLLGMPVSSQSRTNFRTYARNKGTGWEMYTYGAHRAVTLLFILEYATRNAQAAVNASLTAEGYKQGGLGAGVTNINGTLWNTWKAYNPFIAMGASNSLGTSSGEVAYSMPAGYGAALTTYINRYRGIELPFGHIWKNSDGINLKASKTLNQNIAFVTDNPTYFSDSVYTNYTELAASPITNNYIKKMVTGGHLLPQDVDASSSYWADYFYQSLPGSGENLRTVLWGGNAILGSTAGFGLSNASGSPSDAGANFGSRLCFFPAE